MKSQNKQTQEKVIYSNIKKHSEEISEKSTSKLGYLILIIMTIFLVIIGETIFADLRRIPERPIHPSYSILQVAHNAVNLNHLNYPHFNKTDKKFGLDIKLNAIKPQVYEIISLNKNVISKRNDIYNLKESINKLSRKYDLSLQEKIAGEVSIMDKKNIKHRITNARKEIKDNKNQIRSLEKQKNIVLAQISDSLKLLEKSYDEAKEYYFNKNAMFKVKVFLLSLLFVLPFFAFSVWLYLKLKRKNSSYTIILTATTTAFSILFLQVICVFLYKILPKVWFGRVFKLILKIPSLHYIIYYGSVILVIGIFGGLVFYIQKRIFNPTKVAIRRLKDKKCPKCSFPIDPNNEFCPECGFKLKEKCNNCGNLKIRYLSYCPSCGKEEINESLH